MDRTRLTTIAHGNHSICSPLSSEKVDWLLGLLAPVAGGRAVDIGCGKGEVLIRLIERFGVVGIGIDTNGAFLEEAWQRAEGRVPQGMMDLHLDDAGRLPESIRRFDAVVCLGASHALGTPCEAPVRLAGLVRPGGRVLLGEGYWKRAPDEAYLDHMGATADLYQDHAGNAAAARDAGFTILATAAASDDEWDGYESTYLHSVETWLSENANDEDADAFRTHVRAWHDAYLRWGRDTLGFGCYVLERS